MIKFEEETKIFVRYNEEFVKSGARQTQVLDENLISQK